MGNLEQILDKYISPIASKMSDSDSLQAISEGFVRIVTITVGVAAFLIIGNLPITAWTDWLAEIGLAPAFTAVGNASTSILALYTSFTIAYCFAKRKNQNSLSCGLLSMMSFLIVCPQSIAGADGTTVSGFTVSYLGSSGILVALIVALVVGHVFVAMAEHNIGLKMPESVPPMVSESLSPLFSATVIVLIAFIITAMFSFTPYGNAIDFFQQVIGGSLVNIGGSLPAIILICFLANLLWFFGVHPSVITGPYTAVLMVMITQNIADYGAGAALTYGALPYVYMLAGIGGNGNTLGLCLAMLTAKSKRYKQMVKIGFVPNLFNINEPLIFGMPLILNPLFFVPMVFSCIPMGLITYFGLGLLGNAYNPSSLLLPWTTPSCVGAFISGGIGFLLVTLVMLAVNTLIYLPFFKIADKQAYEAELAESAE